MGYILYIGMKLQEKRTSVAGYLEETVNGLDAALRVNIEHAEHGHVRQEIHGAYFHASDLQTQSGFEVGLEVIVAVGTDEVDIVVLHEFAALIACGEEILAGPHADEEHGVDGNLLDEGQRIAFSVDHRKGDEEEQIGHLADGYTLRAITDDAEDGKKSEGSPHTHVVLASKQQGNQHEDAHGEEDEREVVVTTSAFGIVEEVDNNPSDQRVEQKADYQSANGGRKGEVPGAEKFGEECRHGLDGVLMSDKGM